MTYTEYAEHFLGINEEDFNDLLLMFPSVNWYGILPTSDYSFTKEELIKSIIEYTVDPDCDYIDNIEVYENTVEITERLDIENVEEWRDRVKEVLKYSGLTVEYCE